MAQLVRKRGGETLVNTNTAGLQGWPAVASFADGGFVTVWNDGFGTDGSGWGVKAQLFDASGAKTGGEFLINQLVAGNQLEPTVAVLADGNFAVAWTTPGNLIEARLFDSSGQPLGDEFRVNAGAVGEQSQPNIFALAGGGFAVAWWDHAQQYVSDDLIRVQMFDADGERGPELVMGSTGSVNNYPEGVGLTSGNFVVVWLDQSQVNGTYPLTIRGQMFDSTGAAIGGEFYVSPNPAGASFPEIAALSNGGFVAVWNGYDTLNRAMVQLFDAAGAKVGGVVTVGQNVYEPKVTALSWGGFMVAWQDYSQSSYTLKGQLFDSGGNLLGSEFQINTAAGEAGGPNLELTTLAGDVVVAVWRNEEGGVGERVGVKMQMFTTPTVGTSGDDSLMGGIGDDALAGLQGNDLVSGGDANDILDGGAGDDVLVGGAGADTLDGGAGTDTVDYSQETGSVGIIVNLSGNLVYGANGLVLQPGQARDSHGTVDTLAGVENFKTGAGTDIVYGDSAANRIETGDGGDYMYGGAGVDTMIGGAGDDYYFILAEHSATFEDIIVELPDGGTDQVRTSLPSFSLAGLPEIEYLIGTINIAFTLTGNDRDNYIMGNASGDTLEGGLGNDELVGLGGNDTMRGGVGDDIYRVEEIGDVVEENEGEGTDLVWTTLGTYSLLGTNVENLFALSDIPHSFRGSAAGNLIAGFDQNDVFLLQDGGDDEAIGGGGNDVFYFGAALSSGDVADGGEGRDAIVLQGNVTAVLSETNLVDIESISIQSGANTKFGDTANNFYDFDITTADGNVAAGQQLIVNASSLRAGEDFTFDGSAESDGKFLVYGGHGVDDLTGGDGVDVFFFEGARWGADDRVDGGAGRDALVISAGSGLTHIEFGADSFTNIESISLNNRYSTDPSQKPSYELVLHNGNVAAGGTLIVNGSSILAGQVVNVDGRGVHDGSLILFGGGGHDTLIGSDGGDLIVGGGGADGLGGGGGADIFRYDSVADSTGGTWDTIGDFQAGIDKVDLSRIDADSHQAGDQAFHWIGANAFSGGGAASAGELRVYADGAYQRLEGDTDGDGLADLIIVFQIGTAPLAQGDFLF